MAQDGANKSVNYAGDPVCWVRNNSTNAAGRSTAFLKFHLPVIYKPDVQFALLTVRAASMNGATNAQAHVYALTNNAWSQSNLTWATAPNLAQNVPAGLHYTNNFILGAATGRRSSGSFSPIPSWPTARSTLLISCVARPVGKSRFCWPAKSGFTVTCRTMTV